MKTETITRVVIAPQDWDCDKCGGVIKAGKMCVKQGDKKFCAECIRGANMGKGGKLNVHQE